MFCVAAGGQTLGQLSGGRFAWTESATPDRDVSGQCIVDSFGDALIGSGRRDTIRSDTLADVVGAKCYNVHQRPR